MPLWLDDKYLRMLSPQLDRFAQKAVHTYNFRCPLCGDSEKNKYKSRGYMFAKGDVLMFKCHNCMAALPFVALLKRMSRHLYDDYIMERLKDQRPVVEAPTHNFKFTMPTVKLTGHSQYVQPVSECPDHAVYRFCVERGIPTTVLHRLFLTEKAHTWLLPLVGDEKASKAADGIPYLVQPLRLPSGTWYGAQLRMVTRKEYVTFRWSHEPLKMFGLDAWSPDKLTYVVEGPIDALFVPNAISPCGADLLSGVRLLEDLNILTPKTRMVYVWDNEPRNPQVRLQIEIAAKLHLPVVIWPRQYPKDINDMVRAGIDVAAVLPKRTFQGLLAELEFASWQKL